jgi:hypothetical protein
MRVALRFSVVVVLSMAVLAALAAAPVHAGPVVRVPAESYTAQYGTRIVPDPVPSSGVVVRVSHGDWLRYDQVTADQARTTLFCVLGPAPSGTQMGTLDIHIGSPWGAPIKSVSAFSLAPGVKGWAYGGDLFPDGVHTVWIRVRQPRGSVPFMLDYMLLTAYPPPPAPNCA